MIMKQTTLWWSGALLGILGLLGASACTGMSPDGETGEVSSGASDVVDVGTLPEKLRTTLGLYLTVEQAFEIWRDDPVIGELIDVRTPEEYIFVGHPEMARNVPVWFVDHGWDAEKKRQAMHVNPDFVEQIRETYGLDDRILVICRSGKRSAIAVNLLAEAGFTRAHSVIPGFEGPKVTDEGSPAFGTRGLGGWRLAGLPWTYDLDPARMFLSDR
jgi:rhodanese-related sulfurtransferase